MVKTKNTKGGTVTVANADRKAKQIGIKIIAGGVGAMPSYPLANPEVWLKVKLFVGRIARVVVFFRYLNDGDRSWGSRILKAIYPVDGGFMVSKAYARVFAPVAEACGMGKQDEVATGNWFADYILINMPDEFNLVANRLLAGKKVKFPQASVSIGAQTVEWIGTRILGIEHEGLSINVWADIWVGNVHRKIRFVEYHYIEDYAPHTIILSGRKQIRALADLAVAAGLIEEGWPIEEAATLFVDHYQRHYIPRLEAIRAFAEAAR